MTNIGPGSREEYDAAINALIRSGPGARRRSAITRSAQSERLARAASMRGRSSAMREPKASERSLDQAWKRAKSSGGTPSRAAITRTG